MSDAPYFVGSDVSLNHGALVRIHEVCPGEPEENQRLDIDCRYFTDKKTYAKAFSEGAHVGTEYEEKETHQVSRLTAIERWLTPRVHALSGAPDPLPTFVAIEGYAYAMANQAHQLGEVGGVVRTVLWGHCFPFRIHSPSSVKKFATGKGNATKEEMVAAARTRFAFPFLSHVDRLEDRTVEDLADATWLAEMARVEWKLREGELALQKLPEHQRQVFLSVAKREKTNILGRDWIRRTPTAALSL